MSNLSWKTYFYSFAHLASQKSKDETQVGAVLIGPEGEIRLTGFNGPPRGVLDMPERRQRPAKYLFASHAEQNIIAFAARAGIRTEGCTIYVTHKVCSACAKSLIQGGITRIVYGPGQTSMPKEEFEAAVQMFKEAGVKYESYDVP